MCVGLAVTTTMLQQRVQQPCSIAHVFIVLIVAVLAMKTMAPPEPKSLSTALLKGILKGSTLKAGSAAERAAVGGMSRIATAGMRGATPAARAAAAAGGSTRLARTLATTMPGARYVTKVNPKWLPGAHSVRGAALGYCRVDCTVMAGGAVVLGTAVRGGAKVLAITLSWETIKVALDTLLALGFTIDLIRFLACNAQFKADERVKEIGGIQADQTISVTQSLGDDELLNLDWRCPEGDCWKPLQQSPLHISPGGGQSHPQSRSSCFAA